MFNYSPLWETMKSKNISQYKLIKDYNFSRGTLDSLKHNRSVSINTIDDLCQILKCKVDEIVEITISDAKP